MVTIMKNNNNVAYNVKEFIANSADELNSIPTQDLGAGSAALIVPAGDVYMYDGQEWQLIGGEA